MAKKIFPIAIVLFVALIAVLDLANYGIPPTHDGEYHVMRFQQFYKVLSEGNFYPRWAPDFNNGFGIPLFNYVYPLPNYIASFFHFLGFGFIDAFKLNMAAATIVGAIFMYLWSRKYWGETGGVVSSVFYTFSPYHFLDIYVRGSVGEVWSLGLAPALFWAYLNFFETKNKFYLVSSSVFLALLILAHNVLALIFFAFFIAYAGFLIQNSKERESSIRSIILVIFLALGLAAPFWLPAVVESKFAQGLQVAYPADHFPKLYQLIYSSWGYGFSGLNVPDQMSFQIGIANLIGLFGSIIIFFVSGRNKIFAFFISVFMVVIFLITPFSLWFWESIPFINYIQYPWRLLSLAILAASFLAGSLVWDSLFIKKEKLKLIVSLLLIIIAVILSITYAKAPFYHKRADLHYLTRPNFTDGTNSPGNGFNTKWLFQIPEKRKDKVEIFEGSPSASLRAGGNIKINELKSTFYSFNVDSKEDSKILINTAYFPGWRATVNGKEAIIENYKGKMSIILPKGQSNVWVFLDSTPIQKISYIYFLSSVLLIIFIGKQYAHSSRYKSDK